jgi:hypothetical protein
MINLAATFVVSFAMALGQPTPNAGDALLQHVPSGLRDSCSVSTQRLPAGAVAEVDCARPNDGIPNAADYVQSPTRTR